MAHSDMPSVDVDLVDIRLVVLQKFQCWRSKGLHKFNSVKIFDRQVGFPQHFVNGVEVLKQVLTQLLLYYTRFQEIVRKGAGDVPFAADLVPTATILDEIKKYSRIF